MFDFFADIKPQVRDVICIDEKLLDRRSEYFAQPFCYELLEDKSELIKSDLSNNSTEILILEAKDKKLIYKRIYG